MKNLHERIIYYFDNVVARLLWLKYRNRPYIEFYRAVMKHTSRTNLSSSTGGGDWDVLATQQFERLKSAGMLPSSTLFELGCGQLRGGRFSISYLDKGNYYGNDISPEILVSARKVLIKENTLEKRPQLFLTKDLEFNEVKGMTFDFIHAQSVLSHMPPEDVEVLFKNVKRIMNEKSQFLASFFLSENNTIYPFHHRKNFAYPFEWITETASKYGLSAELGEMDQKQKLMILTIKK